MGQKLKECEELAELSTRMDRCHQFRLFPIREEQELPKAGRILYTLKFLTKFRTEERAFPCTRPEPFALFLGQFSPIGT